MTEERQRTPAAQRKLPASEMLFADKNFQDNKHILWSYPTHISTKSPEKESSPNKLLIKGLLNPSDWQVVPIQAGTPQPLRPLKIKKRGSPVNLKKDLSAYVFNDMLPPLNFDPETVVKRTNSLSGNVKFDMKKKSSKLLTEPKEMTPMNRGTPIKKEFLTYDSETEIYGKQYISNFCPYDKMVNNSVQTPKLEGSFSPERKKPEKLIKLSDDIEKLPISFQNLYQRINDLQKDSDSKFGIKDNEKAKNDMLIAVKERLKESQQDSPGNSDFQASIRGNSVDLESPNVSSVIYGVRNKMKSVSGSTAKLSLSPTIKPKIKFRNKSVKKLTPISNSNIQRRSGEINAAEIYRYNRDDINRSERLHFTLVAEPCLNHHKEQKEHSQDIRHDDILPSNSTFRNSPEHRRNLRPLVDPTLAQDPQERILLSITQINSRYMQKEELKKLPKSLNTGNSPSPDRASKKSSTPLADTPSRTTSPEKVGDSKNILTDTDVYAHSHEEKVHKKKKPKLVYLESYPIKSKLEEQLANQLGDEDTFEGWDQNDESELL